MATSVCTRPIPGSPSADLPADGGRALVRIGLTHPIIVAGLSAARHAGLSVHCSRSLRAMTSLATSASKRSALNAYARSRMSASVTLMLPAPK
jgi:hypothetical protein